MNLRNDLLKASKKHFEAQIEKHRINVENLLNNSVGVGEHADIMETIEGELEKMSAYQLVGMDSVTLNAERLIRGESTDNVAYMDMVKVQELTREKMKAFENKHGLIEDPGADK